MIKTLISTFRKRLDDRRRYNKAMAEIEALNISDLVDMGADRTELERGVWRQIYG
jgi:hypothetical protein